jgi:hypothetical protein
MKVDHVTVQVPIGTLNDAGELLETIGFKGAEVDSAYAARNTDYTFRHYRDQDGFRVHTIECINSDEDNLLDPLLTHFRCVVPEDAMPMLRESRWLERDSGHGRIWLRGPGTLRVEVTSPQGLTPTQKARISVSEQPNPEHLEMHAQILHKAMALMVERDEHYSDQWKKYGWRGAIFNLRRKAERAWSILFNKPELEVMATDEDDLLDIVNYAAMCIAMMREQNRDGVPEWWDIQG